MDKILWIFAFLVAFAMVILVFPEGLSALGLVVILSAAALFIFRNFTEETEFVTNVFLAALLARMGFGLLVHVFDLREFFGGDANTYDHGGWMINEYWFGNANINDPEVRTAVRTTGPGWGMNYLVAGLYAVFGRNILLAQSFCAVIGAATAPMVYYCAKEIFQNNRVAKLSSVFIALFPSFIIWSGQLLKDGLIVFLLVLSITMVLQLQKRFNYVALLVLVFSLFSIMSLRFYIFYMVAVAVAGSFLIGVTNTTQSLVRRTIVLVIVGLGLTYFGVIRTATVDLDRFGSLEAVERSRSDLERSADSGFGGDIDVSTTSGAIEAVPVGLAYLMLAPFPWQMSSFRQAITLPEVLVWWAMIPVMIYGLWYTIRHKLRPAFPIVLFSLMLTLAYSIFQGNVGTAYRQRTQIQVFLFMFIAVGWTLMKENRENKRIAEIERQRRFASAMRARP